MNEAVDISDFKGSLDVRRKMFVARGRVSDLKRDCIIAKDEDFDVEHSIFSVFEPRVKAAIAKNQTKPYWSDGAVHRADEEYSHVAPPQEERREVLEFMAKNMEDTSLEHADGSFMDHLTFCRDYCAEHWKGVSPTPLLLHSILGVGGSQSLFRAARNPSGFHALLCTGTNIFPMKREKMPELFELLTPEEKVHVEVRSQPLAVCTGPGTESMSVARRDARPSPRCCACCSSTSSRKSCAKTSVRRYLRAVTHYIALVGLWLVFRSYLRVGVWLCCGGLQGGKSSCSHCASIG